MFHPKHMYVDFTGVRLDYMSSLHIGPPNLMQETLCLRTLCFGGNLFA